MGCELQPLHRVAGMGTAWQAGTVAGHCSQGDYVDCPNNLMCLPGHCSMLAGRLCL
jgi:hypothetical protein